MDALVADDRDDVWRRRKRERVGRLYATAADVQALSNGLPGVRLIKSITVQECHRRSDTAARLAKYANTKRRRQECRQTFSSVILRSGVDM